MRIQPATGEISTPTRKAARETCGTCRYYLAFEEEEEEDDDDDVADDDDDDADDDDADDDDDVDVTFEEGEDDDDVAEEEPDEPDDPEAISGFCRRYPPVPTGCRCGASMFPEVAGKIGWCGEYVPAS